jgi:hypothetical protein
MEKFYDFIIYRMFKQLIILLSISILLYAIIIGPNTKTEHFTELVAVMPNKFIQTDMNGRGNNINNSISSRFLPDNLHLSRFFQFSKDKAKFFPKGNKVVNKFNEVPLII